MKSHIWVTTVFEGFHYWMAAPEHVSYLRNVHRHLFHVKVTVAVRHNDRDVEFHTLLADVQDEIQSLKGTDHSLSCEQMAVFLLQTLKKREYKVVSVEISEDQENGAIVYE